MDDDAEERLARLERRHRWLQAAVALVVLAAAGGGVLLHGGGPGEDGVVRAREVVIEDEEGVVRARLGGELPDPPRAGEGYDRAFEPAGLMLYDDDGRERGGYVTSDSSDNVMLTLDAGRQGGYRQTAFFVANPGGGTALRIWNGSGDHVELRSGSDGARLNAVEDGRLVVQSPAIEEPRSTEMCTELRGLRERVDAERLMQACRERMPEEACRTCLAGVRGDPGSGEGGESGGSAGSP